jgi:signal transduction histidine kinase
MAALDPDGLARWLGLRDPQQRLEYEIGALGVDLNRLGRILAERWQRDPLIVDATWLHAARPGPLDAACVSDPARLHLIQRAFAWAEQTPWSLSGDSWNDPHFHGPELRWLVAEVQAVCTGPFVAPDATPHEERWARTHAQLRGRMIELQARQEDQERLVSRLTDRLDAVVRAHSDSMENEESRCRQSKLAALAQFAAGAGHELNNPLAVIVGRAQLLLGSTSDPVTIRSLRAILSQAQRAHRILRDLMYVARTPPPRLRLCQPDEILRDCLRDLKNEFDARRLRVLWESQGSDGSLGSDPEALRHLAEILLRNALEASAEGGTIRVTSGVEAGILRWTFLDHGRGMSATDAEHLFDPFYCGRDAGRGLGLGLSRAARTVERLGGRLKWRSTAGRGSVFQVCLPSLDLAEPEPGMNLRQSG